MLAWQYVGADGDMVAIDNVKITQGTTGIGNNGAGIDQLPGIYFYCLVSDGFGTTKRMIIMK